MNLQWFPLHIEAYTGDTMHLTTEEHGAYLLMMLAYYRTQRPLPASDRSLAALTKLPLDRWLEAKPALARFFSERNGVWVHDRIEAEIVEAKRKHEESIARAKAGAAARLANASSRKTASTAQSQPKASPKPASSQLKAQLGQEVKSADFSSKSASSNAQSQLEANSKQDSSSKPAPSQLEAQPQAQLQASLDAAHLHLQSYSLSVSENGSGEGKIAGGDVEEAADAPDAGALADAMGTLIPDGWRPTLGKLQQCRADGATEEEIEKEIATFIYDKQASGAFSHDWNASFGKWWERFKSYKAKQEAKKPKAAPRVEVNTKIDWDKHVERWKRNNSFWSRGLGPAPGMTGCQCPHDVMIKHGIDPKTGLNIPVESDTKAKAAT